MKTKTFSLGFFNGVYTVPNAFHVEITVNDDLTYEAIVSSENEYGITPFYRQTHYIADLYEEFARNEIFVTEAGRNKIKIIGTPNGSDVAAGKWAVCLFSYAMATFLFSTSEYGSSDGENTQEWNDEDQRRQVEEFCDICMKEVYSLFVEE